METLIFDTKTQTNISTEGKKNAKLFSIVIPVFNEEGNITIVRRAITDVFARLEGKYNFEIIFVNDGSRDASWLEIAQNAAEDLHVKGICFSRNFGNQYAFEAGLNAATGDAIIMMDGDMEHPPALIPTLIKKWEEGYEVVHTQRKKYQNRSIFKRYTSTLFNRFFNIISDIPMGHSASDFMLMDRRVVEVLKGIHESERFYRGLVRWVGFNATTVEYDAGLRANGSTSHTLRKLISLTWTAITSFSTWPMKVIIYLGGLMTFGSILLLVVMSHVRFIMQSEYFSQLAFLVVAIIGSNGITLMALGIMALYILRIHKEVQRRPNYIVQKTVNI